MILVRTLIIKDILLPLRKVVEASGYLILV